MDLTASEIKEVNSVLRTYIAHAKHKNKKDRLKSALNKLENIEAKKETELFKKLLLKDNIVTFAKRDICPKCLQKVVPSTMEVSKCV